jgi:membrane protein
VIEKLYQKIKNIFLNIFYSLQYSIRDTIRHDGIEHAGYLAFLFILSLFPFLIFLVSIASIIGNLDIGTNLISVLINSVPEKFLSAVKPRIEEITSGPPQSVLTIAFIGIIWTASSAVEGIRTILNRAYRISYPPHYVWRRLLSIFQFIVFVLIIILIATSFVTFSIFSIFDFFDINNNWIFLKKIIIFLISIKIIAFIYYIIPNSKQQIKDTLPGSIICVILFWLILQLFMLYLQNFNQFNLLYGSLAGIIATLMFFFLVGLAFITGAEFNYHFNRKTYAKK